MRENSLAGTRPLNTKDSVPRLIPLYKVRTCTSSWWGEVSCSLRSSPSAGLVTQKAVAVVVWATSLNLPTSSGADMSIPFRYEFTYAELFFIPLTVTWHH